MCFGHYLEVRQGDYLEEREREKRMGMELVGGEGALREEAVGLISERLSSLPDLHLPYSFQCRGSDVTQDEKRRYLARLLLRDPAIFIERYGQNLNNNEMQEFEVLKSNYEVGWHLKQLKSIKCPTAAEQKAHATIVKNRRLAYMAKLLRDGHYFSEEAMRMRAPLLHHDYVGKYQDPYSRSMPREGETWSQLLMRQVEEADFQVRLEEEKERAEMEEEEEDSDKEDEEDDETKGGKQGVEEARGMKYQELDSVEIGTAQKEQSAGSIFVGDNQDQRLPDVERNDSEDPHSDSEEESESLSDDTDRELAETDPAHTEEPFVCSISEEEMQLKLDEFTRVMQEKFLSGEDLEHIDYSGIDHDVGLDDHWLKEVSQAAEDRYFDED